ncbi:GNAT family N-acetyltransferase [Desulfitibacter alkalitolerans]|uniref:GNAT family N-acetyltransferase n=1 Tax=Desulfitibacter alkalitolerans TaxID=264641 RepID=UPI0006861A73|nr:GNAT family N-acetyltransferase [Desulfitibacter alkalitolerans]
MDALYLIREFKIEDTDFMPRLCSQLGYPVDLEEIKKNIGSLIDKPDYMIYVAVKWDGKVVGCIQTHISKVFYSEAMIEINGLVVDEEYRGQGIGERLVQQVEAFAKEQGYSYVNLRANAVRRHAHRFYEKLGYVKIKEQINYRKKV